MSIILKPSALKVKDDNGNYIGTNMFAAESTQEYLDAIETIGTQTQTAISTASTQAQAAMEAKAEQTIESIPDDYTELAGDVSEVKADLTREEARAKSEEARIEALLTGDIEEAVSDWLDEHPEATTTVQDGSITKAKLAAALQYKVNEFNTYYAELDRWQIHNDGTNAETTTANINSMIVWAKANGYNAVVLPAGTYLIDAVNEEYVGPAKRTDAGIIMRDDMALIMRSDTILQVATNGSKAYACITFHDKPKNVMIKGGKIIGDRLTHDFNGEEGSHEYGHGIFSQGVENLIIDDVYVEGCTGDGIALSNIGMATVPEEYFPTRNAKLLHCTIKNSRRNNISVTGAEDVVIAGCRIIGAGTADANSDGTAPRAGIDVEGYGEGEIDYAVTRRIFVINNIFEGNVHESVDFLTGYECVAIGNVSDGSINYANGNNIVIADNVFYKNPAVTSGGAAIIGSSPSMGFDGNYTVISGNHINGFEVGINMRGQRVLATGNRISNVVTGIITYGCSNCEIVANVIDSFSGHDNIEGTGISVNQNSSGIVIRSNVIKNGASPSYAIRLQAVNPANNIHICDNDLLNNNVGILVDAGSSIYIKGNKIVGITSTTGAISVFTNATDVDIDGNMFKNVTSYILKSTVGNGTTSKIRIRNNIFNIENNNAIYITKTAYFDIANNLIVCSPTTNNNRDAIVVSGEAVADTITNRFIGNIIYCDNANNMRYAIKAENGGSWFAGNKIYTGVISHHADDTLIDNYPDNYQSA